MQPPDPSDVDAAGGVPGAARGARLSDVARLAGVSAQTVSNVLNGRKGFGEATRLRVLEAAEQLQFRPNNAARALRTRRTRQIGFHVPEVHFSVLNPFTIAFLRAVIAAVEKEDHQLLVFTHPIDEQSIRDGLLSASTDGFVLSNIDPGDRRPAMLQEAGIPFVVLGRTGPGVPPSWVDIDNVAAMGDLIDYLVAKGYRDFGFMGYRDVEYWNEARRRGALERLAHHGLTVREEWSVVDTFDATRSGIRERLLGDRHPEVVICASDSLATQVHLMATQAGLRPGVDIAITGFDGVQTAFHLDPELTCVEMPVQLAAATLVRLLLAQIEGAEPPAAGTILPTAVRVGGSA